MRVNLLRETKQVLMEHGLSPEDVLWVGRPECNIKCDWASFAKQANFIYDNSYGSAEIPEDLVVVGKDWWLERYEYDGAEWWEFKRAPEEPKGELLNERLYLPGHTQG